MSIRLLKEVDKGVQKKNVFIFKPNITDDVVFFKLDEIDNENKRILYK